MMLPSGIISDAKWTRTDYTRRGGSNLNVILTGVIVNIVLLHFSLRIFDIDSDVSDKSFKCK